MTKPFPADDRTSCRLPSIPTFRRIAPDPTGERFEVLHRLRAGRGDAQNLCTRHLRECLPVGEPAPGSRGRMYIRAFCTRVRWCLTGAGGRHGSGTASLGRAGGRLRGSRKMTARGRRACAREAPAVLRSGPHGGPRRRTPGSRHAPWRVVLFFRRDLQSRLDDDDDFPSNRRRLVPAVPDWGINRRGTPCQSKRG